MGFGDVTLMAMIGSFTGWQPILIIFFLAPFSAILIAVTQFLVSRRHDIAFGPYLCLAAFFWILRSGSLWRDYGLSIYSMGWFVPAVGVCGLVLMGGMLQAWRLVRDALFPWEELPTPDPAALAPDMGHPGESDPPLPPRTAAGQHPLRKKISLQPRDPSLPRSRQVGAQAPGSQLFRR
jgi:hypothetical protein